MRNRLKKLQAAFAGEFDGHIIVNEINMLYLTSFLGAAVMLVPKEGESTLYVYGVNYEAARIDAKNCRIEQVKRGEKAFKKLAEQIKDLKLKKLCFDAMSFQIHQKLKKALKRNISLKGKSQFIWSLRKIKDDEELKKMRKAAELTVEGMMEDFKNAPCIKGVGVAFDYPADQYVPVIADMKIKGCEFTDQILFGDIIIAIVPYTLE